MFVLMRGVIRLVTAGDCSRLMSGRGVQLWQCERPTDFGRGGNQVKQHSFRAFAKRSDPATLPRMQKPTHSCAGWVHPGVVSMHNSVHKRRTFDDDRLFLRMQKPRIHAQAGCSAGCREAFETDLQCRFEDERVSRKCKNGPIPAQVGCIPGSF